MTKILRVIGLGLVCVFINLNPAWACEPKAFSIVCLEEEQFFSIHELDEAKKEIWVDYWLKPLAHRLFEEKKDTPEISPTICRPVKELPQAYLCISARQMDQNKLFSRMSIFSEGTKRISAGTLVTLDHPAYRMYSQAVGGHDLRAQALLDFFAEAKAKKMVLSKREKSFDENVLQPLEKKYDSSSCCYQMSRSPDVWKSPSPFSVITASAQGYLDFTTVVSHELLHAQFYLNPKLRDLLRNYWSEKMSEEDKDLVRTELDNKGYNKDDEYVMIKEFYSYLFQSGSDRGPFQKVFPKHRKAIDKLQRRHKI
ncbi:MAG: hypothetical protein R3A11_08300 [Bdellovibrionota bacterium]